MKNSTLIGHALLCLSMAALLVGCGEEGGNDSITLTSGSVVELYPAVNQSKELVFESAGDWTAACEADWLTFSPRQGGSGKNTITITTASTNKTKSARSAVLAITSGSNHRNVSVVQSGKYAIFDQKNYTVPASGGKLQLSFKTNLENDDNLQMRYTLQEWVNWPNDDNFSRAEWSGKTEMLTVEPNLTSSSRTAAYMLTMSTADGQWMGLDTAYVTQYGVTSGYESTDYTADGDVRLLQRATVGKGISLVLMGDGFADKHIADSTYARVMERAMENIFSEEPVRSMRDYFNVYVVTAVSKSDAVGEEYSTVFSTIPSTIDTQIEYDEAKVDEYTRKVDSLDFENSISVVIVNSNKHNGVTSLMIDQKTRRPRQRSIALCTLMDGIDDEEFRQVLSHEAIGHGLAKLADEYGYDDKGAATDNAINELQAYHRFSWMMNVDVTDDVSKVLWNKYIGDGHFASEGIGVYEGGYTYVKGIYRPTQESMMRHNDSPFNAPSRKAIFDRIRALGEDKETSTLGEFAAFDELHKPSSWNYATTRAPWQQRHYAPPVIKWTEK